MKIDKDFYNICKMTINEAVIYAKKNGGISPAKIDSLALYLAITAVSAKTSTEE